ncbi:GTP-binding protein [Actinokineospora sp. G85]|uniref:GTP-binding protein n=1 Tax=Actinokineospora sp. G85 TaxID=3406626 RepID=UPI003C774C41
MRRPPRLGRARRGDRLRRRPRDLAGRDHRPRRPGRPRPVRRRRRRPHRRPGPRRPGRVRRRPGPHRPPEPRRRGRPRPPGPRHPPPRARHPGRPRPAGLDPPDSRRGRFDDVWAPPLRPHTPLHPAHGISVLRFTTERPFHPNRLNTSLDTLLEDVIRTRGRLHLASQPTTALWLESAGGGLSVGNLGPWPETDPGHQDLVIITTTRTPAKILEALHGALATDEELALLTPAEFTDPFAEWEDELEDR